MTTYLETDGNATLPNLGGADALLRQLFEHCEDLIKRVADIDSAEIQKVRAKVRIALMAARSALQEGASGVRRQALLAANTADDYVRLYPWQSVLGGGLLGVALAVLLTSHLNE